VIRRIIVDLVGGAWTVLGLLFAVVVLPAGETQQTMAALFSGLTLVWLVTGPLRWKD
jgi:predicted MFS family arabinose efflux permease